MVLRLYIFFSFLCLFGSLSLCRAQSEDPIRVRFDSDIRLLSSLGQNNTQNVYSSSLRLESALAGGWNAEVSAKLKDRPFLSRDIIPQQVSLEKEWKTNRLQAGLVRLPFGIYNYQETYASGLIDYPLPRVDYGLNSVDWGVPGAKWSGGSAKVQYEVAGFAGRSSGVWATANETGGAAVRIQSYAPNIIVGVSNWTGYLRLPDETSGASRRRPVAISGIDVRYTRPHLLVRGEMLYGTLGGNRMSGGYLDLYYHLPKYEKFTFVARVESLRPDPSMPIGKQITLGIRYTAAADWTFAINWRRNNFDRAYQDSWTPYSGRSGMLLFQIYHKSRLR
jgi:hypothetical protein